MADLEFIRCSGINEDFIMNCQLLDMEYDDIDDATELKRVFVRDEFQLCEELKAHMNFVVLDDMRVKRYFAPHIIIRIMEKCDVCRIALNNNGYPYILPLNFGMKVDNNIVELYFHGANEGMKYDLIQNDNRASFEMDCEHRLVTKLEQGSCTLHSRWHIE